MPIRDASKSVKFIFLDGTVVIPLLFALISPSKISFGICFGLSIILTILSRRGMNLHMLSRKTRTFLIGRVRAIRPSWRS